MMDYNKAMKLFYVKPEIEVTDVVESGVILTGSVPGRTNPKVNPSENLDDEDLPIFGPEATPSKRNSFGAWQDTDY